MFLQVSATDIAKLGVLRRDERRRDGRPLAERAEETSSDSWTRGPQRKRRGETNHVGVRLHVELEKFACGTPRIERWEGQGLPSIDHADFVARRVVRATYRARGAVVVDVSPHAVLERLEVANTEDGTIVEARFESTVEKEPACRVMRDRCGREGQVADRGFSAERKQDDRVAHEFLVVFWASTS